MKPLRNQHPPIIALLSAAGISSTQEANGALRIIAGKQLLVRQISALELCGVRRFLLEVELVPRELLHLIDDLRKRGVNIDFVRSVADLKQNLSGDTRLATIAESHYLDPSVLQSTIAVAPAIATVDGRDDNARFERIDLNTRWAGFAVYDADVAVSMDAVPDGWSLTSSLLRHAIRSGVPFQPVSQSLVREGRVLHVESESGPEALVKRQLKAFGEGLQGGIERYVFAPVAVRLAPLIWSMNIGQRPLKFLPPSIAGVALAAGFLTTATVTAALALAAIFALVVGGAVDSIDNDCRSARFARQVTFAMLGGALLATAWFESDYGGGTPALALIMIAMLLVANRLEVVRPFQWLLKSPATVTTILLIGAAMLGVTAALQWTALLLAGMLVAVLYWPASSADFTDQP
jgi:hypothetical protein